MEIFPDDPPSKKLCSLVNQDNLALSVRGESREPDSLLLSTLENVRTKQEKRKANRKRNNKKNKERRRERLELKKLRAEQKGLREWIQQQAPAITAQCSFEFVKKVESPQGSSLIDHDQLYGVPKIHKDTILLDADDGSFICATIFQKDTFDRVFGCEEEEIAEILQALFYFNQPITRYSKSSEKAFKTKTSGRMVGLGYRLGYNPCKVEEYYVKRHLQTEDAKTLR